MKKVLQLIVLLLAIPVVSLADNPHGPTVVADVTVTAGNANSSGTLVSPSVDTVYTVFLNQDVRGVNTGNSQLSCNIFWSAPNNGSAAYGAVTTSSFEADSVRYLIVTGGGSITYSCTYTANSSADPYDLSITVLKM